MRETFITPEDAELAFYDALEQGDIDRMKQVWMEDDSIVCIHPGAIRLEGRAEVFDSFAQIFHDAPDMEFVITDVKCVMMENVAVHMVREEVTIDNQLFSVMLTTNIYYRVNGSWRMSLHHASHEPDMELDEIELGTETETPIVLH